MPEHARQGRGLVFFARDAPPLHRRRRIRSVVVVALCGAALIWPVYPLASRITPYVLGLPFSFAWTVIWLLVMFVGMIALYRSEPD